MRNLDNVIQAIRKRRRILDYASDTASDEEVICMTNTSRGNECNESDNESCDSFSKILKDNINKANFKEILKITDEKRAQLQGLYIHQINHLHHLLREKRRTYLSAMRREREHLCSIKDQLKDTTRDRTLYKHLHALSTYRRRYGPEALLYKKYREKRDRNSKFQRPRTTALPKCKFTEGGVKCGEQVVPTTKFCLKHVLEDKKQLLFQACGKECSGVVCRTPVPRVLNDPTCILHLPFPENKIYVQQARIDILNYNINN